MALSDIKKAETTQIRKLVKKKTPTGKGGKQHVDVCAQGKNGSKLKVNAMMTVKMYYCILN